MEFIEAARAAGLDGMPGKKAVKAEYRAQITVRGGVRFSGSVDLDKHFQKSEPNANRWDYGIGFNHGVNFALWVEPHPASGASEVDAVIRKLDWLKSKLGSPGYEGLAALTTAAQKNGEIPFRWLYSGRTSFRSGGNEARQLAQHGMRLPERHLSIG